MESIFQNFYKDILLSKISSPHSWPFSDDGLLSIFNKHCVKSVQIRSFSGPYFPVFGLNAEIYEVNLRIQSKYGKMQTRKNSVFGHFSHSEILITTSFQTYVPWNSLGLLSETCLKIPQLLTTT